MTTKIKNKRGHKYEIISEPYQIKNKSGKPLLFVDVKFTETGSIRSVRKTVAEKGEAKDMYAKDVYGVGCKGNIKKVGNEREYQMWRNMLARCYVERNDHYSAYGALGTYVSDDWLCFETFYNDLKYLPNYNQELVNAGILHLDKDMICEQESIKPKVYSRDTCMFLTHKENVALQRGKKKRGKNGN